MYIYIYLYIYIYVHVNICICTYLYVCVCLCVHLIRIDVLSLRCNAGALPQIWQLWGKKKRVSPNWSDPIDGNRARPARQLQEVSRNHFHRAR